MVGRDGEWWIERGVALFKDLIAGRQIVRGVEKVAAHSLLLRDALAEQLLQHPELAACQQPAQAVATAEAAASASGRTAGAAAAASSAAAGSGIRGRRARRSAAPDSFAPGRGGCRMLDAGHQVRREAQRDEARSVLTTFFTAMAGSDVDGWTLPAAIEAVNSGRLRVFKRAHMPHDGGDVTSSEYRRSRSRVSCFVRQTWEDSGSLPYICDVVRLVLLEPPTATAGAAAPNPLTSTHSGAAVAAVAAAAAGRSRELSGSNGGSGGGINSGRGGGGAGAGAGAGAGMGGGGVGGGGGRGGGGGVNSGRGGGAADGGGGGGSGGGVGGGGSGGSGSGAGGTHRPLRLAFLDVYKHQTGKDGLHVVNADERFSKLWPVRLEDLGSKVTVACPDGLRRGKMYFADYTTLSRLH
jgi:hypothetical protein